MDGRLENYLEQIDRHLRPMPASERVDIVREIKSEMLELEDGGLAPEAILARLGSPRELAAAYLGDAIARSPGFSWRRLGTVAAFYSLAGMTGMFVLPVTSVLAVGLMISGIAAPLAGLVKFLGYLAGVDLPYVMFQFGSYTASPLTAFPLSVAAGVLLYLAGRGLWRLTVGIIRHIGAQYQTLKTPAVR